MAVREQSAPLEVGELRADGRRRDVEARPLDERLRPDRLPLATYSSTIRRRISRWRSDSSMSTSRPS
jgi:hypothetical protein